MSIIGKKINGEKYVYLLMAMRLCKQNNGKASVGNDAIDYMNYRYFSISQDSTDTILWENKETSNTNYSKHYIILDYDSELPDIYECLDSYDDGALNFSKVWKH